MRLADLDLPQESSAWRLESIPELDDAKTVENLCVYYLSRVISRAQAWIQTHRQDLLENQSVRWSVNVGVPVEYCDSPALDRFNQVLSLAWLLNYTSFDEPLTLQSLNQIIEQLQYWHSQKFDGKLDCETTPEISAAVWSFLSSRQAQDGFYTFFDVGDGTLDGASFHFSRAGNGEQPHVDFYSGRVKPLGVTVLLQQAASEIRISPDTLRLELFTQTTNSGSGLYHKIKRSTVHRHVQQLIGEVVMNGHEGHKRLHPTVFKADMGQKLRVFIAGGGGKTDFYQNTIQNTHQDFQQDRAGIPAYQIKQIPVPRELLMNGINRCEFHRFAVAYGLSIPHWEGAIIRLPSQLEVDSPPTQPTIESATKYEDTRDLC
ncbi:MAG: hypothetical protein F6K19_28895 [Cyanothece sp. SIO1E1]|nr:hypothetical protein [Cyanothece sp. SIO1E1]